MKRNLLLISNSTNPGEPYLGWPQEQIKEFLLRHNVKKVLFIPFAGISFSYDEYETKVKNVFNTLGFELKSIHHEQNPIEAVINADAIAVGGGNTYHLAYQLQKQGLMQAIREKAMNGMPYMGWSAGSNIGGPTLCTTNDMPIIEPLSFDCMNLVPFQINPHYTDFFDPKHGGETRDDRIKEFLHINKNMYVAGIREATSLLLEKGKLSLVGRQNKMKVFKFGEDTKEYAISDDINFLMKS